MPPPHAALMPLSQTLITPPGWTAAQRTTDWLTPDERQRLAAFPSPARRADWLAGRLALKRLLQDTFQIPSQTCSVTSDGLAPALPLPHLAHLNWSLSHSAGWGAATYARTHTEGTAGLDIQHIRPTRPGLAQRILSPSEHAQHTLLLSQMTSTEAVLLFWALKEAAIKARRLPWNRPLSVLQVHITGPQTAHITLDSEPRPFPAAYARIGPFWLARALRPPP